MRGKQPISASALALLLVSCVVPALAPSPSPVPTAVPEPSPTAIPPMPLATPTMMAPAVEATTLRGKVILGYQGWFSCPGDGAGLDTWLHAFDYYHSPVAENLTVDFWPDNSELTPQETCGTSMSLHDGSSVVAFSNIHQETVNRHFEWMVQYGIDGIELGRFVVSLKNPSLLRARNLATENVRNSAEIYGRVFYIIYDMTGADPRSVVSAVESDWMYLVDHMGLTRSSHYLHHRGLPLVGLWGFGFENSEYTPEQAMELLRFFQSADTPERYRATVKGGIPYFWRTRTRDGDQRHDWS